MSYTLSVDTQYASIYIRITGNAFSLHAYILIDGPLLSRKNVKTQFAPVDKLENFEIYF